MQNLNFESIAQTTATRTLAEIQLIIKSESLKDFDKVEQIVAVFEHYGFDSGAAHDF